LLNIESNRDDLTGEYIENQVSEISGFAESTELCIREVRKIWESVGCATYNGPSHSA